MKAIIIIASVIAMVRPMANAQTDTTKKAQIEFTTNVDLYSRYLWRGMQNGNAPAIQPTLKLTYKNFSLGSWGSYQFDGILPETDLFATYTLPKGFAVTINDYFVSPSESSIGNYVDYDVSGLHQIEGCLTYTGPEKLPLSVTLGYTFHGAKFSDSVDASGKQPAIANMNESFYGELGYTVKNFTLILGGGNKYYAGKKNFAVVNIGAKIVKNVEVTDKFTLPITGQIMFNPNTKHIYYTVGFSF